MNETLKIWFGNFTLFMGILMIPQLTLGKPSEMKTIQPDKLHSLYEQSHDLNLIDVRESYEFEEIAVPYATNFPLQSFDFDKVVKSIQKNSNYADHPPVYFICRSGNRSKTAAKMFLEKGYENVYNVEGGMLLWSKLGLPTISKK